MDWHSPTILVVEITGALLIGGLIGWAVAYWRGRWERLQGRPEPVSWPGASPTLSRAHQPSGQAPAPYVSMLVGDLAAVFDAAGEGLLLVDAQQQVLWANSTMGTFLDLAAEQLVGRSLWELVQHWPLVGALERAQAGTIVTAEVTLHHPRERIVRLYGLVLDSLVLSRTDAGFRGSEEGGASDSRGSSMAHSGPPARWCVIVARDMTELRRLEQHRREFLANVSHELKTPLAAIRAAAETLQTVGLGDDCPAGRFIQHILDNTQRLHRLVQDVLQLARIEAGQQTWHKDAVSVAEVVQDVVERHQARAEQKGLALQVASDHAELRTWVDAEALTRILENLLDNAIKYTHQGSITLRWWPEGRQVVLEIADTGEGIAAEHLPRIFERFYRVDQARSRELGGSGLGLAIVKHLVQAMDGTIHVHSQPGVGTCFTVRLPAAELPHRK
ncbi:MAG: ATP-binding protein [Gemmatales bacterium]|nr:ATP-binding protein [Gemmatales bacterium]MDW7995942.1 ATP-binding protein [Gemmatales bacterium]